VVDHPRGTRIAVPQGNAITYALRTSGHHAYERAVAGTSVRRDGVPLKDLLGRVDSDGGETP
jgi:hypothetical protein